MERKSSLWYFEQVDLFEIFCPRKQQGIDQLHEFLSFKKDEFIYFSEEEASHIFLIAEGRVKIGRYSEEGKEITRAILQPGEIFGELALMGADKRNEFAQAMDKDVKVCPLTIEDMEGLMKDDKELSLKITRLIGLRLIRAERKIESLVFKDSRSRIIDFLRDLADERGQKVGFEILVKNFFTHQDIANLCATSRQTVTTVLNELREKNILTFDRRRLLIRDISLLK